RGHPSHSPHLKSLQQLDLLHRKRHAHSRHEARDRAVVQGHCSLGPVHRHDAALALQSRLGMYMGDGQTQMDEEGGRKQPPAGGRQPGAHSHLHLSEQPTCAVHSPQGAAIVAGLGRRVNEPDTSAHSYRIFGLAAAYKISTTRLITENVAAMSSVPPWTIG